MDCIIKLIVLFIFFHAIYATAARDSSTKIIDTNGKAGFGISVAMNKDFVVVGSVGEVSVYKINGNEFQLKA